MLKKIESMIEKEVADRMKASGMISVEHIQDKVRLYHKHLVSLYENMEYELSSDIANCATKLDILVCLLEEEKFGVPKGGTLESRIEKVL